MKILSIFFTLVLLLLSVSCSYDDETPLSNGTINRNDSHINVTLKYKISQAAINAYVGNLVISGEQVSELFSDKKITTLFESLLRGKNLKDGPIIRPFQESISENESNKPDRIAFLKDTTSAVQRGFLFHDKKLDHLNLEYLSLPQDDNDIYLFLRFKHRANENDYLFIGEIYIQSTNESLQFIQEGNLTDNKADGLWLKQNHQIVASCFDINEGIISDYNEECLLPKRVKREDLFRTLEHVRLNSSVNMALKDWMIIDYKNDTLMLNRDFY